MVHHVRFLLANKNSTLNFSVYPTPIQAATEVKQYHSDSLLSLHLMWRKMGIHRMLIYPTDRKFNRMRPSMARVLGLETRSAKEG